MYSTLAILENWPKNHIKRWLILANVKKNTSGFRWIQTRKNNFPKTQPNLAGFFKLERQRCDIKHKLTLFIYSLTLALTPDLSYTGPSATTVASITAQVTSAAIYPPISGQPRHSVPVHKSDTFPPRSSSGKGQSASSRERHPASTVVSTPRLHPVSTLRFSSCSSAFKSS